MNTLAFQCPLPRLLLFVTIFARVTVMLWFVPLFPRQAVTRYAKIALAFFLSFTLTMTLQSQITIDGQLDLSFALLLLQEIATGLVMGFVVFLMEQLLWAAGSFIAHLIGLEMAEMLAPGTMTPTSPLALFCFLLGMMILLANDAHHLIFQAFALSFEAIPPGKFMLTPQLCELVWQEWHTIYRFLIILAAPLLLLVTVVTVEMGILGRMVPQMNILLMEYPLRLAGAFVIMAWFLPSYCAGVMLLWQMIIETWQTLLGV